MDFVFLYLFVNLSILVSAYAVDKKDKRGKVLFELLLASPLAILTILTALLQRMLDRIDQIYDDSGW